MIKYFQNLCPNCMSALETFLLQVPVYELLGMHVSTLNREYKWYIIVSVHLIFNEAFIFR